jgi:DNA-binding CsgD family transcriptional regulator
MFSKTDYPFTNLVDLKPMIDSISNVSTYAEIDNWLNEIVSESNSHEIGMIGFLSTSPTTFEHKAIGQLAKLFENSENIDNIYQYCKKNYSAELMQIHDIDTCYLVPLHGANGVFGCVIMALQNYNALSSEEWFWSIIGSHLLQAFKRAINYQCIKMTQRERDCILWASEGKTSWEISKILGITERTVNFHLSNCIEKTNSVNRQQAIVRYLFDNELSLI